MTLMIIIYHHYHYYYINDYLIIIIIITLHINVTYLIYIIYTLHNIYIYIYISHRPSAFTAHVWCPAAMALTGPRSAGTAHWPPLLFQPKQTRWPSAFTATVCPPLYYELLRRVYLSQHILAGFGQAWGHFWPNAHQERPNATLNLSQTDQSAL